MSLNRMYSESSGSELCTSLQSQTKVLDTLFKSKMSVMSPSSSSLPSTPQISFNKLKRQFCNNSSSKVADSAPKRNYYVFLIIIIFKLSNLRREARVHDVMMSLQIGMMKFFVALKHKNKDAGWNFELEPQPSSSECDPPQVGSYCDTPGH